MATVWLYILAPIYWRFARGASVHLRARKRMLLLAQLVERLNGIAA
jgi:hypothetical protein